MRKQSVQLPDVVFLVAHCKPRRIKKQSSCFPLPNANYAELGHLEDTSTILQDVQCKCRAIAWYILPVHVQTETNSSLFPASYLSLPATSKER